jgi:hypothetical protein
VRLQRLKWRSLGKFQFTPDFQEEWRQLATVEATIKLDVPPIATIVASLTISAKLPSVHVSEEKGCLN